MTRVNVQSEFERYSISEEDFLLALGFDPEVDRLHSEVYVQGNRIYFDLFSVQENDDETLDENEGV